MVRADLGLIEKGETDKLNKRLLSKDIIQGGTQMTYGYKLLFIAFLMAAFCNPSAVSAQSAFSISGLADNWEQLGEQVSSIEYTYCSVHCGMGDSDLSTTELDNADFKQISGWYQRRLNGEKTPLQDYPVTFGLLRRNDQGKEYGEFRKDSWVRPVRAFTDQAGALLQKAQDRAAELNEEYHHTSDDRIVWDGTEAKIYRADSNELYTGRTRADLQAYPILGRLPENLYLWGVRGDNKETGEVFFSKKYDLLKIEGASIIGEDTETVNLDTPGYTSGGGSISIELSKNFGLLPTRISTQSGSQEKNTLWSSNTEIEYMPVDGTFFPQWGKKTITGDIRGVPYVSVSYYYTDAASVKIDPDFESEDFQLSIPKGTEVFDPVLKYYITK